MENETISNIENNENKFNWKNNTFKVVNLMLQNSYIVKKIQQDSYNDFVSNKLKLIIEQYNPIVFSSIIDDKEYNIEFYIENPLIYKPKITENNGMVSLLTPSISRKRNFTYSSQVIVTITKKTSIVNLNTNELLESNQSVFNNINIGKIPIMVNSKYCVLQTNSIEKSGECICDQGGYFIINGNEKVIVGQERVIDNYPLCVLNTKCNKFPITIEFKSSIKNKFLPTKPLSFKISCKDDVAGNVIKITMPYLRQDIPLFILFRAFGFINDKQILDFIVYDINSKSNEDIINVLKYSIEESSNILDQESALEFISKYVTNIPRDVRNDKSKLNEYVYNLIKTEYLPHVGNSCFKKVLYTGYIVKKLINCYLGKIKIDDRDSYLNKRVDGTGVLLGALFRQYYTKMLKDLKTTLTKEFNNGSWKVTNNFHDMINQTNIYKLVKPTICENGMKYALATGNFGMKNTFNKVGISQLLSRLSYYSAISHLRRINTPIEKCGKLIAPRKLHTSQWGMICCAETPEGASVGVVKNFAMSSIITHTCSLLPVLNEVKKFGSSLILFDENEDIQDINLQQLVDLTKIFLNGDWIGSIKDIISLYNHLIDCKRKAIINIYTSITFDKYNNELYIYNDAGRIVRPLYIVENNKFNITSKHIDLIDKGILKWDNLISGMNTIKFNPNGNCKKYFEAYNFIKNSKPVIEYIDVNESYNALIAMDGNLTKNNYTHAEIHPCLILGAIASTIPFSDHNQSPRNCYQSAMGKQAIGIYVSNFQDRMDTIAHILCYPQRPLITTFSMDYVSGNQMPSGMNCIVGIMSYTGYNQEDSILLNKGSVNRGLFQSIYLKTYKEEEKKNQSYGEEEKFCIPDSSNTTGIKVNNYSKLTTSGVIKEGEYVKSGDVIIGKCIPIKKKNKQTTYKDNSIILKNNEYGIINKVYVDQNGDGYRFCKIQIRNDRYPQIGDKFSSKHGQKGTVGMIIPQDDMPFTKSGISPDIIMNPHAVPSRMTIGQLIETLLGKVCTNLGYIGDGTPFTDLNPDNIEEILIKHCGYERYGNEFLYNGTTGEQLDSKIFIGPTYYQRLKHMVNDKFHSRSTGPIVLLTRQPAEGRTRDGGLRFGEMERDCIISHGSSSFLKERLLDVSDNYRVFTCEQCKLIASCNPEKGIYKCDFCDNTTDFHEVRIPYASKLLMQELLSMSIATRMYCE